MNSPHSSRIAMRSSHERSGAGPFAEEMTDVAAPDQINRRSGPFVSSRDQHAPAAGLAAPLMRQPLTQLRGGFLPEPTVSLMISILRIRGETTGCLITLRRFGQEAAA